MATRSIRTSDERKTSFEGFCESIGITATAAINMFIIACLRENKIPFEIKADPFWSYENQERLRESIKQLEDGKYAQHDLIEVTG